MVRMQHRLNQIDEIVVRDGIRDYDLNSKNSKNRYQIAELSDSQSN